MNCCDANGNCNQGRACDCTPDAGPQAACTHGMEDAAPKRDPWVYVYGWGAAALTVGWLCFLVMLWRAA